LSNDGEKAVKVVRGAQVAALLTALVLAVGCGGSGHRVRGPQDLRGYTETGLASWYGKPYHGRPTASGERYDMHALTAAHRTLPFGTVVRVRNLENGREIRVRITDRGPFVDGRIIDLSLKAARKLDMVRAGLARVELRVGG
jgi:rare lipoprotein A